MKMFIPFLLFLASCDNQEPKADDQSSHLKTPYLEEQIVVGEKTKSSNVRMNPLKAEEMNLKSEQATRYNFDSYEKADPICRRFSGCLKFCSWWNQSKSCNKWPVSAVIALWLSHIDGLSHEQLIQTVERVAQDSDVALFLHDSDFENRILKKLISRLSEIDCPLIESADVYYIPQDGVEQVHDFLFLAHPDGPSHGLKKIVSTEFYNFNLLTYKGFMRKCLNGKKLSFIESAAVHKNWRGFMLAHRSLIESCGEKSDCIHLAYCKLNSPNVSNEIKALDKYNTDIKFESLQCDYSEFSSLPF